MLRRGQTNTFQERLDISERAAGQSDPEIAATLGCSIWMVRKPQSYTAQEGDCDMCLS